MSDDPNLPDADHELDVDISAFLPEGSRFAAADDDIDDSDSDIEGDSGGMPGDEADVEAGDGWGTGAPAPEIPAWARDDLPPPPDFDDHVEAVTDGATESELDPEPPSEVAPDSGPAVSAAPEVDTTVLTRVEGELADVDAAIAAIDAGDLSRSPLLTELLAADQAPDSGAGA